MTGSLLRYRIMAYLVGTLLIVLVCVGVPLDHWTQEGTTAQGVGAWITSTLGVAHGFLYMVFVVTALLLARKAGWSIGFSVVTLLLGTVPVLSFYAERRATAHTRSIMRSASTPSPSPSPTA